mmetsp:Transcript_11091/g.30904  ORF Transcript_11091/g.30904 Transcript_11091/m.30904 type:complete len:280 (-) Transcript_11091:351-1190(-)
MRDPELTALLRTSGSHLRGRLQPSERQQLLGSPRGMPRPHESCPVLRSGGGRHQPHLLNPTGLASPKDHLRVGGVPHTLQDHHEARGSARQHSFNPVSFFETQVLCFTRVGCAIWLPSFSSAPTRRGSPRSRAIEQQLALRRLLELLHDPALLLRPAIRRLRERTEKVSSSPRTRRLAHEVRFCQQPSAAALHGVETRALEKGLQCLATCGSVLLPRFCQQLPEVARATAEFVGTTEGWSQVDTHSLGEAPELCPVLRCSVVTTTAHRSPAPRPQATRL